MRSILCGVGCGVLVSFFVIVSLALPSPAANTKGIAAAVQTSPPSVTLSWIASTVQPGSPLVTQYNILRGTAAGAESATPIGTSTTTNFTDASVTPGATYFYVVTAQNQCNGPAPIAPCVSGKSNEVGPLLIPNPVPPNAPTGLTATVL
jgi:fibronectin type 3 domain-containing protein